MDVGNPSNLERLQWLFRGDVGAMRTVIASTAHTDRDVRLAIDELYDGFDYVADPHTAIASLGKGTMFLATAHPAKFADVVEDVIPHPVQWPPALAETLSRRKVVVHIGPTLAELAELL
jgi:threonine synthase